MLISQHLKISQSTRLIISLLVSFVIGQIQPLQASQTNEPNSSTPDRPRIGLVLSGGGARGSAHIGILEILEQNHIPIDYIAGTSMGSVIGALYASGMTPDEITQALSKIDWESVFNDNGPRSEKTTRDKADDRLYQVDQQIGVKDGSIHLPTALIQGQRFELILRKLTLQASLIRDFDKLPIPFRAIATDITTGEEVVIGKGDLSVAIRASMAVPGAFAAVEIDGRLLVDGGMANNLPVNVVREMGADIVIAIDISTPLLKREELNDALSVIDQLTGLLTRGNVERQINGLSEKDILIIPEMGNLSAADFSRYEDAINIGITAATKQLTQLKSLSISPEDYTRHTATHNMDYFQRPVIEFIHIDNNSIVNDEVLRDRLQIKPGDLLDTDIIDRGINEIYTLGNYSHVGYAIIEEKAKTGLKITAREKVWGTNGIQFGLELSTDLDGSSSFDFSVAYTQKPINGLNGEWRTIAVLGENPSLLSEWYQPLDNREKYFINPIILGGHQTFNIYSGDSVFSKHRIKLASAELWLGRNFGNQTSRLRFGISRATGSIDLLTGDPTDTRLQLENFDAASFSTEFRYDEFNTVSFPTSGSALEIIYLASRESLGAETDYDQAGIQAAGAYPLGTGTLLLRGGFNTTLKDKGTIDSLYQIGGFLNLSGLQQNQLAAQHSGLLLAAYMHKLNHSRYFSTYAGASIELGNAWQDRSDISMNNMLTAGSVFLGTDSPVGPVYIAFGASESGEKSLYLFIGSPWF
jgi:NTE family protein